MVSYEKKSDLEERDTSVDTKDTDSGPTTSNALPLSTFPEGGWRAWSVVIGVYDYFTCPWRLWDNQFCRWLTQFCTFGYLFSASLFRANEIISRQDTQMHMACTMVWYLQYLWLVKLIFLENRFLCSKLSGENEHFLADQVS